MTTKSARRLEQAAKFGDVCEAELIDRPVDGLVTLRLVSQAWPAPVEATLAIDGRDGLGAGDRVLVALNSHGRCYVIGVIERKTPADLVARGGARARLQVAEGAEALQVLDAQDRLIFEYRPEEGGGSITMPLGNLALRAPQGDIVLEAGGRLRGRAGAEVDLAARSRVRLSAGGAPGDGQGELSLSEHATKLKAQTFDLAAARASLRVVEADYLGVTLNATLERVGLVTGKMEHLAERIIERAVDVYREVRGLCQLKAGRMRSLVEEDHYAKSKRSYLLAEEDVTIDGDKIRLG